MCTVRDPFKTGIRGDWAPFDNPHAFDIGGHFKPKVPAPPEIPKRGDPAVKEAGEKERKRRLKARGRSSTILTGGMGVMEAANIGRKTLLGQ